MKAQATSPTFLWQSCGTPSATWFLVLMPLVLLALAGDSSLASAMVRLLAVLLVAGLIWARGRGPSGTWAERIFIGAWAAAWTAALGTLVTAGDGPASLVGSLSLISALVVGAGWLGWVCQLRQDLQTTLAKEPQFRIRVEPPANHLAIGAAWLSAALLLALALVSGNAHWGDAIVLASALAAFTAFQTAGLRQSATSP